MEPKASKDPVQPGEEPSLDPAKLAAQVLRHLRLGLKETVTKGIAEAHNAQALLSLERLFYEKGQARVRVDGDRPILEIGAADAADDHPEDAFVKAFDLYDLLVDERFYASECRLLAACLKRAAKRLDGMADEKIASGWGIRPVP